jgi:solute carrier family 35 protein F1/2
MRRTNVVSYSQILALCITSTNTFTTLLAMKGTSIPAFQSLFNYVLLALVYGGYTIYSYGFRGWLRLFLRDWWKCESIPASYESSQA